MTLGAKDPNVAATYTIDWHDELVVPAYREYAFAQSSFVQGQRDTGWYYECTTAGRTAHNYPQWPRAAGETVQDGSAAWTARHPSSSTVPQVSSAVWTVIGGGMAIDSQAQGGALSSVVLSGGTDGVDYEVHCRMTPTIGAVMEKTITVPVRAQ